MQLSSAPSSSTPLENLLFLARKCFHSKEFTEAAKTYNAILQRHSMHPEAHRALGHIALLKEQFATAVSLLEMAVSLGYQDGGTFYELGSAYVKQGNAKKAVDSYKQSIAKGKRDQDSYNMLAGAYIRLEEYSKALSSYEESLKLNPHQGLTLIRLAKCKELTGDIQGAINSFELAHAENPQDGQALMELIRIYLDQGNEAESVEVAQRLLSTVSNHPYALMVLADASVNANDFENATKLYLQAGESYWRFDAADEAKFCFEKALQCQKNSSQKESDQQQNAGAISGLGLYYHLYQDLEQAEQYFLQAMQMDSQQPLWPFNLGCLYLTQKRWLDAKHCFENALTIKNDFTEARINLAKTHEALAEFDQAMNAFHQAEQSSSDNASLRFHKGLLQLKLGILEEGWLNHEWRVTEQSGEPYLRSPLDNNKILERPSTLLESNRVFQSIVALADQDLEFNLFFFRFVKALRENDIRVKYIQSEELAALLTEAETFAESITIAEQVNEQNDIVMSIADLPLFTLNELISETPLPLELSAQDVIKNGLKKRLERFGSGPYLAVSWQKMESDGDTSLYNSHNRIDPSLLAETLQGWPGSIICVQSKASTEDMNAFVETISRPVLDLSEDADDLPLMLALLDIVDEYIAVSDVKMQLRASLGKQAKVLVPAPGHWQWMSEGDSSPWFPSITIYREQANNGWNLSLQKLSHDLIS